MTTTNFLKLLSGQMILTGSPDYVIYRLLEELATMRDRRKVIQGLLTAVRRVFALQPFEEQRYVELIQAWQYTKERVRS